MKLLIRLFFISGMAMAALLVLSPETLRFISVPAAIEFSASNIATTSSTVEMREESGENSDSDKQDSPNDINVEIQQLVSGQAHFFQLTSADPAYLYDKASAFCLIHAPAVGIPTELIETDCIRPLVRNIQLDFKEGRYVDLNLSVEEQLLQQESLRRQARQQQQATPSSSSSSSAIYKIQISLGDAMYRAVFDTGAVTAAGSKYTSKHVAYEFCAKNARALGINSQEELDSRCVPHYTRIVDAQVIEQQQHQQRQEL